MLTARKYHPIIEKLEKMINDEIKPITYKKWFAKLSAEKGSIEIEMNRLSKITSQLFDKLEQNLPILTNLKNLYCSIKLQGKQALLNKVLEGGLIYDGVVLRTPRLHLRLIHNYMKVREKRLLLVEQPEDMLLKMIICTAYGSLYEHLSELAGSLWTIKNINK